LHKGFLKLADLILGSGIIGCIAKFLHPDSIFIPFKKSRYYTFDFPLADNFIVYSEDIDDFMVNMSPKNKMKIFFKSALSFEGQLLEGDEKIKEIYLKKLYDDHFQEYAPKLITTAFSVYPITAIELYSQLQKQQVDNINTSINELGDLVKIDVKQKMIIFKETKREYDRIISTIPLNALLSFCGMNLSLKSKDVCYYRITSEKVDLEGRQSCFVADEFIEFFKVVELDKHMHMFWTFDKIENPYQYFGSFLTHNIGIEECQRIEGAIPIGEKPDLSELEGYGIYCVGSNAQHDDFMDISSCIKRLLRLRNK